MPSRIVPRPPAKLRSTSSTAHGSDQSANRRRCSVAQIAFLPSIYDSLAAGRKAEYKTLKAVAKKNRGRLGAVWLEVRCRIARAANMDCNPT